MQSVKYQTVLYTLAYKMGYDPLDPNFPRDEAIALGTYIDQWVTRLHGSKDWPEWTKISTFQPDANHIVPWEPAVAFTHDGEPIPRMWRVFAVYLVDPRTVYGANSTKFYLREDGIHCGYEHGLTVWIKYIEPPPRFTSIEWDASTIYKKNDVVYSLTTGEVYKSKSNGNRNHDPGTGFSIGGPGFGDGGPGGNNRPSTFLPTEVLQTKSISQFGTVGQNKIMIVYIDRLATVDTVIPDPPAAGSSFRITVMDSSGTIITSAFSVGDGVVTLSGIATDLATQLSTALGVGWTVTAGTTEPTVTIENASDFQLVNPASGTDWPVYYATLASDAQLILSEQLQAYVAAVANATITPQIMQTTLSNDQLIAGATYSFTFKDLSGNDHFVEYQSMASDGQDQIIAGILAAIPAAATLDNYFSNVLVSSDPTTPSLTFTVNDHASLNAVITLPGSPWWEVVPFPLALKEQVIRGAYADALKDWGQTDKAAVEEQGVGTESDVASGKFMYAPTLPMTDQVSLKGRYKS